MLCSGQKGLFAREKVPKWGICKPGARRAGGRRIRPDLVCVRKPNSLAYRGGVRKPGGSAGRVHEGPAGFGLRTKTEFIGFQRRRTQTGRLCQPGSRGSGWPWFAYENRIYWLTGEAYANRETLPAGFMRGRPGSVCVRKPNSLAFRGGVRKPGDFASRVQEGPGGLGLRTKTEFIGFQRRRTQTVPAAAGSQAAFFAFLGPVVCVRKPNPLALRAGVRKPEQPGRIQEGPASLQKPKNFESADRDVRRFKVFSLHITSYL